MRLDLMNTREGVKYVCMYVCVYIRMFVCTCVCIGNIFFLPLVPLKVYCSAFHCSIEFYAAAIDGKVCNITKFYDFILLWRKCDSIPRLSWPLLALFFCHPFYCSVVEVVIWTTVRWNETEQFVCIRGTECVHKVFIVVVAWISYVGNVVVFMDQRNW